MYIVLGLFTPIMEHQAEKKMDYVETGPTTGLTRTAIWGMLIGLRPPMPRSRNIYRL